MSDRMDDAMQQSSCHLRTWLVSLKVGPLSWLSSVHLSQMYCG